MTRDDIIRMAREAGMPPVEITSDKPVLYPVPDAIERFAAFVAAHEREECAKLCDEYVGPGSICADVIRERNEQEKPR